MTTKKYKHKKLGWIAFPNNNQYQITKVNQISGYNVDIELIENSDDREEIKTPTHFGNGMVSDLVCPRGYHKPAIWFDSHKSSMMWVYMTEMIYKIRQRHSDNDGKFGDFVIFFNGNGGRDKWDWGTVGRGSLDNPFFPMFSSQEKAQACIDHFGNKLDILLSWYNMQRNNQ